MAKALDTISSNITLVNTSKLLQVTTTKRIATSTTYFLVKTQNSVQQANSLNKIDMQPIESSNLRQKLQRNSKALQLNRAAAKKRKKNNSQLRNKHANPMRSSSSSVECFSPTQKKAGV